MTTNDETPPLNPANLHRAMPRHHVERDPFEPKKIPLSIQMVGFISLLVGILGAVLIFTACLIMYAQDSLGGAGFFMIGGSACIVSSFFGVASYHVANAVMDIRDMMQHRGN